MSKEITALIPNNMKIKIVPPPETKYSEYPSSLHLAHSYINFEGRVRASPSVVVATLPADNLICIAYFTILSALASKIPTEATQSATVLSIWQAEVNSLGDLVHPNLVKLIGYCIEDDQTLLVYEFMPQESLENHLFRSHLLDLKHDFCHFGHVMDNASVSFGFLIAALNRKTQKLWNTIPIVT
ncbi:hypothetical protein H5410_033716 [Solanum commersonii]|uniref:Serine-threonine/tyrosine-protein kinase catalytic domain-containing protein n=1 Tax=Solanum commersonii TaxID=4109 RepID=A0A9J5YPF0_SOLCO|nr:hypothetical protein H5410_033716 [Solanum commersonii]